MYNLRYHIASLVAVFLALSIGLLLGSVVVERGILDRQRESIVQGLQEEFQSLDSKNRKLTEALASREDLVDTLGSVAVDGVLADKTVLVLASSGRADGLAGVRDAVTSAGGTVVVFVLAQPSLGLDAPPVSSAVTQVLGPLEPDAMLATTTAALVAEWATPSEARPLTAALSEAGVLRVDGDPGGETAVDGVVTLAYFDETPDDGALAVAVAFAEAGQSAGQSACGVETQTKSTGVALAASEAGLSAVDHIGTPEGAYSLTWILSGKATGYFGYREGAQDPWPK